MANLDIFTTTISNGINFTFGQVATPIITLLIFVGIAVKTGLGFESTEVFFVALVAIMVMGGMLSTEIAAAVIIFGSIAIYLATKRLWGI
jgi:hypothetical protein